MKYTTFLFIPFFILFLQACNMVNPKESIPTYIEIDSVHLQSTLPSIHGTVSHKITDVWVYYERQLIGAYQLPAKVPVITDHRGQLQVIAGIYEDGLSGIRAKYPFYSVDTFSFDPNPTNTIAHIPTFIYRTVDTPATTYFVEDFEQGNSFEKFGGDTTFVKTNEAADVFEGSWSNKLLLFDTITSGKCVTVQEFTLPSDKMCYVELNYKNDIPFVIRTEIGFGGLRSTLDMTGVNRSSTWGKIYFNFGRYVATYPNAKFRFVIEAALPAGSTTGKILIDNFKVIHFQ